MVRGHRGKQQTGPDGNIWPPSACGWPIATRDPNHAPAPCPGMAVVRSAYVFGCRPGRGGFGGVAVPDGGTPARPPPPRALQCFAGSEALRYSVDPPRKVQLVGRDDRGVDASCLQLPFLSPSIPPLQHLS